MSCTRVEIPSALDEAMEKAGNNRSELVKIIEHYSTDPKDSLKLKASVFLLSNLTDSYYFEGELLDQYMQYLKLIRRDRDHGEYFFRSFNQLYGSFSRRELDVKFDLKDLGSEYFIRNIDMSFKAWREFPWSKNIPFDIFCEYILPFRIGDSKPVDRKLIFDQLHRVIYDEIRDISDPVEVARILNDELKFPEWILTNRVAFLPCTNASYLLKYKAGTCRDMSHLAVYSMRAMGVPVGIDFLPQWPYRDIGHIWNVVFDKDGKATMFEGAEDNPGTPHKPCTKKAKVFRYTFSRNPASLAMQKDRDPVIPDFLQNPRLKDVSEEYFRGFDIKVSISNDGANNNKYAYLSAFDNKKWIPIQWGKIDVAKEALFSKMEGDIVYLPCLYSLSGIIPANYPVLLSGEGAVQYLRPNFEKRHNIVTLSCIFPIIPDLFTPDRMVGGVFQGANSPEFKDARTLDSIKIKPYPFWNEVRISNASKFRYVRYLSSMGGHCNISELEFYSAGRKLNGRLIGTSESYNDNPDRTYDKAMDGDMTTFFDAKLSTGGWVGLDLKRPEQIDKIRFSSTMSEPGGNIIKGHIYELFYWDNPGRWVSLGTQKANGGTVSFGKVPSNALYYVQDRSEERDSRIFTISGGTIIWR